MPYPTPGFVVKKSFLEFEGDGEQQLLGGISPAFRRRRAGSDSHIYSVMNTRASLYGSEEMRLMVEGVPESAEEVTELTDLSPTTASITTSFNGHTTDSGSSSVSDNMAPVKVKAQHCSAVLLEHIRNEGGHVCGSDGSEHSSGEDPAQGGTQGSEGSRMHPEGCAPPCKYNTKRKGCKDGAACTFCHLCQWKPPKDKTRHQRRRAAIAAARERERLAAEAKDAEEAEGGAPAAAGPKDENGLAAQQHKEQVDAQQSVEGLILTRLSPPVQAISC